MDFYTLVIEKESIIRLSFFLLTLFVMGSWEITAPRRTPTISKVSRWANNLGLVFINAFVLRLVFPLASTGVAMLAYERGWGILNYYDISTTIGIIIFIFIMDLTIYLQHVMVHAVPLFWRFHRVHHADLDYDTTTGIRFHTFEIVFSMFIKFTAIVLLGPAVIAVIFFEIILNSAAMFNHGNVGLPKTVDKVLRWFIVTPDMHRVHHSIEEDETNSNFGFNLSIWDRVFGTYREKVRAGQIDMIIGLKTIRKPKKTNFIIGMLLIPFTGKIDRYVINSTNKKDK